MLTKEECLESYEVIDTLIHLMCGETREDGYEPTIDETINSMRILKQLIDKHFELIDLFKKHKLENLTIEELDKWFDRSAFHVNKVNELSHQLVNLRKDLSQKKETIDKLRSNSPLKFEELKEGMWVWDKKCRCYVRIIEVRDGFIRYIKVNDSSATWFEQFEENRFYRREVKE